MKTRNIIKFGLFLTLFGCGQSGVKVVDKILEDTTHKIADTLTIAKSNIPDTSNQYIYDFMKVVIADQKLDLSYGLIIKPEQDCDLSQDDTVFLKTLLIEKSKKHSGGGRNMTINIKELPKCLTKADIKEMLTQKERLKDFNWDNSRLGFNISNDKNWYCFSIPLFSEDRKKVVMMIRNMCPGLCGTGWTLVFTNVNNKWTSKIGGLLIH